MDGSSPLFDSVKREMLQILQKPHLQFVVLTAGLRERSAECAEYAAIAAYSEVKFGFYVVGGDGGDDNQAFYGGIDRP